MQPNIYGEIVGTTRLLESIVSSESLASTVMTIANICTIALRNRNRILLIGNGGSAANAQHLAAELVGRLLFDRPSIPALALTADTVTLTALSNDYGYEQVFARQIDAVGHIGDVLIALSTSGRSSNLIKALEHAQERGLVTVCFLGASSGKLGYLCDYCLHIPSNETQKVQVGHVILGHILCALIEEAIFSTT